MQEQFIIAENKYKQKIILDPNELQGRGILKDGLYDRTGIYFIEKILAKLKQPITLDIGANIGNHALRMSPYSQMVYLFEPQSDIVAHLETTMKLNQLSNWKIFHCGLGDEEKTLTLYKNHDGCNGETTFVPELKGKNITTELSNIYIGDSMVFANHIHRIDFIKIDVEGYEAKVVSGLQNSITQFRPIIFMEWDKEITKREFQTKNLFNTLFKDFIVRAITRNPDEATLLRRIKGKIRRTFNKTLIKRRSIIGSFNPDLNYRHILLIPREKSDLVNNLSKE